METRRLLRKNFLRTKCRFSRDRLSHKRIQELGKLLLCVALLLVSTLPLRLSAAAQTQGKIFLIQIRNETDHRTNSWTFGEGVWVLHDQENPLFKHGERLYDNGMEHLIEQGKAHEILKSMTFHEGIAVGARFPKKTLRAGEKQSFVISALPGQRLSFAIALLETDDKFLAPTGKGIALFDFFKNPLSATVTDQIHLWDGGSAHDTEPKQNIVRGKIIQLRLETKIRDGATTKADANSTARLVTTGSKAHEDGYHYPHVETIMFVSIKAL